MRPLLLAAMVTGVSRDQRVTTPLRGGELFCQPPVPSDGRCGRQGNSRKGHAYVGGASVGGTSLVLAGRGGRNCYMAPAPNARPLHARYSPRPGTLTQLGHHHLPVRRDIGSAAAQWDTLLAKHAGRHFGYHAGAQRARLLLTAAYTRGTQEKSMRAWRRFAT